MTQIFLTVGNPEWMVVIDRVFISYLMRWFGLIFGQLIKYLIVLWMYLVRYSSFNPECSVIDSYLVV